MMRRWVWVLVMLLGCGDGAESEEGADEAAGTEVVEGALEEQEEVDTLPLPMPDLPEPRDGRLTTAIAGDFEYGLTGSWEAWAGRCDARSLVQLIAQGTGFGTVVLIATPDSGNPAGSYEVTAGTSGVPQPFEARVGVQEYPERQSFVFHAVGGEVIVDSLNSRMYGRLTARIRERTHRDTVPFAAVFHDIEVRALEDEWCQIPGDQRDSVVRDTPS